METEMLTKKQSELLRFIHERLQEAGVPPSFDEMKEALELRSKSGIHRLIMALEERGFIRRLANRARAIEVLRLPESATVSTPRLQRFSPSVIPGNCWMYDLPAARGSTQKRHFSAVSWTIAMRPGESFHAAWIPMRMAVE